MNGVAYFRGYRYTISNLDLAFLADMGLGTINDDVFDQIWLNILRGGAGEDVFAGDYSGAASAVTINGSAAIGSAPGLQLYEFERFDVTLSNHNDTFVGTANNDVVRGGAGHDSIDGGIGADAMIGGTGNDTFIVDNVGDSVSEQTGEGADTVLASITYSLAETLENLTLTGAAAINGSGNSVANTILGNNAANVLYGRASGDTLDGAGGNDTLYGGDGIDSLAGGEGADLLDGGNDDDALLGAAANDVLYGRAGADVLDGGAGADSMFGGAGDDQYAVDNVGDIVGENAASGADTVTASISYALTAFVENLTLSGGDAINGTGNVLANIITGNAAANTLSGLNGADTLHGGDGGDTLNGGAGNDVLNGEAGADILDGGADLDTLNGGADGDTLYGRNSADTLNGDAGNDVIYGGDGDDTANGGADGDLVDGGNGNDTLAGGDGDDEVYGRQNNDTLNGGAGADDVYGGDGDDVVFGGDGDDLVDGSNGVDRLDGGAGADSLNGGAGADTFVFSTLLGGGNVDVITGFNVVDDTIELAISVFGTIAAGPLAANAFVIGAAAADADDRIIYDPATGALWYDADGDGGGAAVQFATLATGLALTSADFVGGP
jgi:Ca2+-binding RTX toxin-like protein